MFNLIESYILYEVVLQFILSPRGMLVYLIQSHSTGYCFRFYIKLRVVCKHLDSSRNGVQSRQGDCRDVFRLPFK